MNAFEVCFQVKCYFSMSLKHLREFNNSENPLKSHLDANIQQKLTLGKSSRQISLISDQFKTWEGTPVPAQIGLFHISVGKRSAESAANLSADTSSFLSVETEVGGGG